MFDRGSFLKTRLNLHDLAVLVRKLDLSIQTAESVQSRIENFHAVNVDDDFEDRAVGWAAHHDSPHNAIADLFRVETLIPEMIQRCLKLVLTNTIPALTDIGQLVDKDERRDNWLWHHHQWTPASVSGRSISKFLGLCVIVRRLRSAFFCHLNHLYPGVVLGRKGARFGLLWNLDQLLIN